MNQQKYIKISENIRKYRYGEQIVRYVNQIATLIIYAAYLLMLAVLLFEKDNRVIRIVLVTGISFILVSLFRYVIDTERPYVKYNFHPIIKKDKAGQSMPSRHVFSAFIIGMAFLYWYPPTGIFIFAVGVIIGVGRVIACVHFPKDVLVGAILGIVCGWIGFYLI